MEIEIEGWEDGSPVKQVLTSVDRWRIQNALQVTVRVSSASIKIAQQPHALSSRRVGVGACLWDSSFVLTAFLAGLDPLIFAGARVVELGAGLGLPGLFVASQGANVTLTDKQEVLSLTRQNVLLNAAGAGGRKSSLLVDVAELDWSSMPQEAVRALARPRIDFILAADCLYIDEGGSTPSAAAFLHMCAALCWPSTSCYVALEQRSSSVMRAFHASAAKDGFLLERLAFSDDMRTLHADHILLFRMSRRAPIDC